jgi:hypothetical protein
MPAKKEDAVVEPSAAEVKADRALDAVRALLELIEMNQVDTARPEAVKKVRDLL